MDLVVSGARLPGRDGQWTIGINDGRILSVTPDHESGTGADTGVNTGTDDTPAMQAAPQHRASTCIDVAGNLVIPGLVDAHFHLDKVSLLDRFPSMRGDFQEAMEKTLEAKQMFTIDDIQERASRHIEQVIGWGTTAMRSHVEVDPVIGLTAMQALLPLRDRYTWGLTLQLAAFAQEGITPYPETVDLLKQAMRMGADVIGSAPYVDPDPEQNIRIIFDIAEDFNCDVDFHLDFLDDEEPLLVPVVINETCRRGWQGRVSLGHMTKLAGLAPAPLRAIATQLADAGISVLTLPASDLYMMARNDTHNARRGVAPVHQLAHAGVNVGLATNNVRNLFTPFGDGDVLKICTLLAQVLHLGTVEHHQFCLDMATGNGAMAIGLSGYGLQPGCRADLVILNARTVSEAIGACPVDRTVIKDGAIAAESQFSRRIFRPAAV